MGIRRRQLLQYTGAASVLAALPPLQAAHPGSGNLRVSIMPDAQASPRFAAGELLIVDTACTAFTGAGIYFYPAWGRPRPWLVTLGRDDMLEFRNPGSDNVAWVQSLITRPLFAGSLHAPLAPVPWQPAGLPPLEVPPLPGLA